MFENLKQEISLLVEKEIQNKKQQLIGENIENVKLKDSFKFLDPNEIKNYHDGCIAGSTFRFLFKEPHFQYRELYTKKFPEDGYFVLNAWLSKDLNTGIVAVLDEDNDEVDLSNFKIHRRGVKGRGVKCNVLPDEEKNFLKHYDDFIAEIILLGLDETETESKGQYE